MKGFGIRVTAAGAKAFILNYRTRTGRERRYTIGSFPDWKTGPARDEAARLKKLIDVGHDPMAELDADRDAKTVADLCARFVAEHLAKKRPSTVRNYRALIDGDIMPALKHKKVAEVEFTDVDSLHRRVTKRAPYMANRTVAVLSKMFALAVKWKWRNDNPVRGIERNHEEKRERYLSSIEIDGLTLRTRSRGRPAGRQHNQALAVDWRTARRSTDLALGPVGSLAWRLVEAERQH